MCNHHHRRRHQLDYFHPREYIYINQLTIHSGDIGTVGVTTLVHHCSLRIVRTEL